MDFDNKLINKAYEFALEKHKGQKYGEKDFIYHPVQVYEIITRICPTDINLRVASLGHDLLEQTETTASEIKEEFGEDVLSLILEVTKTAYNTFPRLSTRRGVILKFADRLCNLVSMQDWNEEKQLRYINKSKFWKS